VREKRAITAAIGRGNYWRRWVYSYLPNKVYSCAAASPDHVSLPRLDLDNSTPHSTDNFLENLPKMLRSSRGY
jgi:hypothetical protein